MTKKTSPSSSSNTKAGVRSKQHQKISSKSKKPSHSENEEQAPPSASEKIDAILAQSHIQEKKKKKRKQNIKKGGALAGILLFIWLLVYLFTPNKGNMAFGMCKVFLELSVQYPQHLRLSTVDFLGNSLRIWYTQLDGFGQYRMEPIQCYFKPDKGNSFGYVLDKVTIKRREVDPERVEAFNKNIISIFAYPPDLVLPTPIPDSLENMHIDIRPFLKPI